MQFVLTPRRVTSALWWIVAVLAALHVVGQIARWGFGHDVVLGLVPLFNLDRETNIPAFYSALSLLLCAALAAFVAVGLRRQHQRFVGHWAVMAAIFTYLSMDEFVSLHERLTAPVSATFGVGGAFSNAWVLPYGLAVLLLAAAYLPLLRSLPPRVRTLLVLAATIFVGGAIGMEIVAGVVKEQAGGQPSLLHSVCTTIEEWLEMAGVVVFVQGMTTYIVSTFGALQLRLVAKPTDQDVQAASGPEDGRLDSHPGQAPGGVGPRRSSS